MSYSIEALNNEDNSVKKREAQQEQIYKMLQLHDGKIQRNGTKVEDSSAITSTESKTDSIEISTQGQKALEQMKAAKANINVNSRTQNVANTITDTSETTLVHENPSISATESSSKLEEHESKGVSEMDLYSMSKSDLSKLVSQGIITGEEMDNELDRRGKISFPPQQKANISYS